MKRPSALSLVVVSILISACASSPPWLAAHVTEIRFREGVPGELVRTIKDPKEIQNLIGCFNRATRVADSSQARHWTHCFDPVGTRPESGRRLYNTETGEFSRLNAFVQPVYRFTDADRVQVNQFFAKVETSAGRP